MVLNKFDIKSDGVVDLYRAALYLARGADKVGLEFMKRAEKKIGKRLVKPPDKFENRQQQLFWAEKILDQYLRLKRL